MQFEDLVPPHRPSLLALAKRFTGQEHTAEDLVQETLIKAYSFWFQFTPETDNLTKDVRNWLSRILSNIFYSQYGKEQRRTKNFDAYESITLMSNEEDTSNLDIEKIHGRLDRLLPKHRDILKLHYFDGHSCQDIAELYGIRTMQVQKKLWQARQVLKRELLQAGFADQTERSASFVDTSAVEPSEGPKTDPDTVQTIVGDDDTASFIDTEATEDTLPAW